MWQYEGFLRSFLSNSCPGGREFFSEVSSRNRLGGESDDSGAGFLFSKSPDWVVFQVGRRSVVFLRSALGVMFWGLT